MPSFEMGHPAVGQQGSPGQKTVFFCLEASDKTVYSDDTGKKMISSKDLTGFDSYAMGQYFNKHMKILYGFGKKA